MSATGGFRTRTWSISSGSLPPGLLLTPAGTITGTPSAAGIATVTFMVTDALGATTAKPLTITTNSAGTGGSGGRGSGGVGAATYSLAAGAVETLVAAKPRSRR